MTVVPFPKPAKPIRGTAEAREYMGWVAQLPCCICQAKPVEVHHCSHGRYSQRRTSDFDTIPLCPEHHRFRTERGATFARMYGEDHTYIPATRAAVERLKANLIGGR